MGAEVLQTRMSRRDVFRLGRRAAVATGGAALLAACADGENGAPAPTSSAPRTERSITPIPFETVKSGTQITIGTLTGARPFSIPSEISPDAVGSKKTVALQAPAEVMLVERNETNQKNYDAILAQMGLGPDGGRILFVSTKEQRDRLAVVRAKISPGAEYLPPGDPDADALDASIVSMNRDFLNRYDRDTLGQIQRAGPPELIDISLFVVVPK